jgi:hypothetical protein
MSCGGLLLRDSRSASSTAWYSLISFGCFQRFAMRWRSRSLTPLFAGIARVSGCTGAGSRDAPVQGWKAFLNNHADSIAAMDLFVVRTNLVSFALRPPDHGAWPAADSMVWCYIASDCGMDRQSAHGSMWLGTGSPLSDPRPGRGVWRDLRPKTSINRHSRSTDVATFPMAKRNC